jgi:hypothetical protein
MNKLILVAVISFGIGSITGGLTVYLQEGPRPLNAFEQMMVDAQKQHEKQMKDLQKALANSPAFPGGMGKSMMGYSGPPEQSSGAKKK